MELNLITLFALAVALLVGGFVGVGLGRRSTRANEAYDNIREKYDAALARAKAAEAKLKDRG